MKRPVLLGGRAVPRCNSLPVWIIWVWLPVVICLMVVAGESTDTFSSARTSGPLRHLAEWLVGPISLARWDVMHHWMRKTGHFIGYGLMGTAWLRGWLLTWRAGLQRRPAWVWRGCAIAMALCCTMLAASCDELHQSYLPSRTGLVSDIWLDTSGAAVLIFLLVAAWRLQEWSQQG